MFQKYMRKLSHIPRRGFYFFHFFLTWKDRPIESSRLLHSQLEAVESPCFKQEALKLLIDHGCPVDGSNEEGETVPLEAKKRVFVKILGTDIFGDDFVNLEGVEELMIKRKKTFDTNFDGIFKQKM